MYVLRAPETMRFDAAARCALAAFVLTISEASEVHWHGVAGPHGSIVCRLHLGSCRRHPCHHFCPVVAAGVLHVSTLHVARLLISGSLRSGLFSIRRLLFFWDHRTALVVAYRSIVGPFCVSLSCVARLLSRSRWVRCRTHALCFSVPTLTPYRAVRCARMSALSRWRAWPGVTASSGLRCGPLACGCVSLWTVQPLRASVCLASLMPTTSSHPPSATTQSFLRAHAFSVFARSTFAVRFISVCICDCILG